jgi:prepilin-type N-terminal cleavage/methylation domain-containing protein
MIVKSQKSKVKSPGCSFPSIPYSLFPIPCSPGSRTSSRNRRGFTLVELLIASTVLSLILTSLCGIYLSVAREWERQNGRGTALGATSMACTRLSDYISQSVGVVVVNRLATGDALAVNLPSNSAYGTYVPTWSGGKVQYQSGSWIIFYLSDSTGNYNVGGNILWAATMNWGRIAPISSIQFSLVTDSLPRVTITATSTYNTGTTQSQVRLVRTVCLQNAY